MNEEKIKENIREIMNETCNTTMLSFRGINENTIYNELDKRHILNDFVDTIDTARADCIIFNILNSL